MKTAKGVSVYFWTMSYFKPHILMTSLYVALGGMVIFGEVLIPRALGFVIDHVIPQGNKGLLYHEMMVLGWLVLGIILCKAAYYYFERIISNRIVRHQQTDLMSKLNELGFSYYEKNPTGKIISIFENAVKQTQQTYTFLFPQFIYSLAQFTVPSIILLVQAPVFFLAAMVGNILYMLFNHQIGKKIEYYLDLESKASHDYQQKLYDAMTATNELKAMGSESWFIKKTIQDFKAYRKPRMQSILWRHIRFTVVGLTLMVSIGLFYYFGMMMIKSGDMLLGEFIGYSFLMGLISRGFSVFFYIIPAQQHALNYATSLYEFMNEVPDVKNNGQEKINDEPLTIEFDHVSFGYHDEMVLKDVSLKINPGEKLAIVGGSGSGKSTIIKLIGRFYDVNKGCIKINGQNIQSFNLTSLRDQLGYVFQETHLLNQSIKNNLLFGRLNATEKEIIEAAVLAKAHDFILSTDAQYDTIVGEGGLSLSGGQKQRIAFARMALKNAPVLLLDEATSALDNVTEQALKEALNELAKNKSLITVAHRLSTIEHYDRIIVLDKGQIVEEGTYESLMKQQGYFHELVRRGAHE